MNIIILARERSARFPRKHLAMIAGVTLIAGIVERCLRHGKVYLATGPMRDNRHLGRAAVEAGANPYYESYRPEWDIHSRVVNLCDKYGLDNFLPYSGDSPWVDERMIDLVGRIVPIDGGAVGPVGPVAPGGIEATGIAHLSTKYFDAFCDGISLDDRRREEPWQFAIDPVDNPLYTLVPVPWERPAGTAIKTSIDYPLEAAVADKICRYLGRWPRTDDEILKAYKEITEL